MQQFQEATGGDYVDILDILEDGFNLLFWLLKLPKVNI